ncbi:peroxiredoxin [bacterium]|nr:MAG: peroxiredoxin [bacterium]
MGRVGRSASCPMRGKPMTAVRAAREPIPSDDGAAAHLGGASIPDLTLPTTADRPLRLRELCAARAVLYVYPATGVPGRDPAVDPAPGWDDIAGASGCTAQSMGFRAAYAEFEARAIAVAGLSTQPLEEQTEFARRHELPFPLLHDEDGTLERELRLPSFTVDGRVFLKRLVLYIEAGRVVYAHYPVYPPAESAKSLLAWLAAHLAPRGRSNRSTWTPRAAARSDVLSQGFSFGVGALSFRFELPRSSSL